MWVGIFRQNQRRVLVVCKEHRTKGREVMKRFNMKVYGWLESPLCSCCRRTKKAGEGSVCASGGGLKFYVVWRVFRVRAISNRQNVSMTSKISREECEGVGQERNSRNMICGRRKIFAGAFVNDCWGPLGARAFRRQGRNYQTV